MQKSFRFQNDVVRLINQIRSYNEKVLGLLGFIPELEVELEILKSLFPDAQLDYTKVNEMVTVEEKIIENRRLFESIIKSKKLGEPVIIKVNVLKEIAGVSFLNKINSIVKKL